MAMSSGAAPAAPVSGDQVNSDGVAFAPATLTVSGGATVTWTNRDE
jgi:plastocyanin